MTYKGFSVPYGSRTRVAGMKILSPRPLDEGDLLNYELRIWNYELYPNCETYNVPNTIEYFNNIYHLLGERRDLNPRPPGPQPGALPTELRPPCD
jgi:hypothetical protein